MVVGLGSGSTAEFAIEVLAARIAQGLGVTGIPTSQKTAAFAWRLRVKLTSFAEHRCVDIAIDGADHVARRTLALIKGRGGALLREKIVASASKRMIVVVDETKLVDCLGDTVLPVEIVAFGWQTVLERLRMIGSAPQLRLVGDRPFTTHGGNYIADCAIGVNGRPRMTPPTPRNSIGYRADRRRTQSPIHNHVGIGSDMSLESMLRFALAVT